MRACNHIHYMANKTLRDQTESKHKQMCHLVVFNVGIKTGFRAAADCSAKVGDGEYCGISIICQIEALGSQ